MTTFLSFKMLNRLLFLKSPRLQPCISLKLSCIKRIYLCHCWMYVNSAYDTKPGASYCESLTRVLWEFHDFMPQWIGSWNTDWQCSDVTGRGQSCHCHPGQSRMFYCYLDPRWVRLSVGDASLSGASSRTNKNSPSYGHHGMCIWNVFKMILLLHICFSIFTIWLKLVDWFVHWSDLFENICDIVKYEKYMWYVKYEVYLCLHCVNDS